MAKPIEIPIKISGVTELRSEIKRLQGELINATDPEEVGRLSSKIGELKDQFSNVNEQAAIFASGSKYEQVNNALGATGSALANLDFGKAEQRAKALAQAAGNITFKDAITSVKQLGNTFLTLGKALLTNPLFLLAAVIGGIVIGIVKLLDKLGVFKKAMELLGSAIDFVVQLLKDFLDLIGLTDFAAEDAFQAQQERNNKLIDSQRKLQTETGDRYDFEIAKARAAGLSTVELEAEKRTALLATLKAQNDTLRAVIQSGKATEDQIKIWNENQAAIRSLRQESELAAITAKRLADEAEKKRIETEESLAENTKKANKKAFEDRKKAQAQFDAQRLAVERQLEDLRISQIEDETKRTLAENKVKYERLIADTLANENLLEIEKLKLIQEFKNQKLAADNVVFDKEAAEAKKRNDQKIEEEKRAQEELSKILKDAQIEKEQIAEAEKVLRQGVVDASIAAFGQLSNLLGQSTKAGKVAALADIATQTAVGFVRGLDIAQKGAQATGPAAPFAFPLFYAQQIGAVLGAANQAKSILKGGSASGGSSSGGGGSFGGQAPPQPAQPSFNLFGGANDFNNVQAPQSVEANQPQVVRAVVSETDLRNTNTRLGTILNTSQL